MIPDGEASDRIGLGCGYVAAAVGELPGEGAGLMLAEMPARCLLSAVVPTAQSRQIALAGCAAAVIGDHMIKIAAADGPAAARE